MKRPRRNPYLDAFERDKSLNRQPWEESALSKTLASRKRKCETEHRIFMIVAVAALSALSAAAILLVIGKYEAVSIAMFAISFVLIIAALILNFLSISSGYSNIRSLEDAFLKSDETKNAPTDED